MAGQQPGKAEDPERNKAVHQWLAREQDRSGTTADRDGTDGAGIKRFISGKSNEELEKGIHDIVTSRISQEALDRYHDKIHELIRLCCPFEIFTQEQIGRAHV